MHVPRQVHTVLRYCRHGVWTCAYACEADRGRTWVGDVDMQVSGLRRMRIADHHVDVGPSHLATVELVGMYACSLL